MTWGRMDDKFHRNRKVRELRRMKGGREALGDWAFWWSWCLDDPSLTGVVPAFELDASEKRSASLLVSVGLWDVVDGGYQFHDFHEYNPRREQREAKKAADRERIAEKRAASRNDVARDTSATRTRLESESHECPPRVASTRVPNPTQPNPTHERAHEVDHSHVVRVYSQLRSEAHQAKTGNPGGTYRRTTRDWQPVEDLVAWAREQSDPAATLEDSLRGYLADEWATGAGWPISTWAKDPGRYNGRFQPRGGTYKAAEALERAEVATREARLAYEACSVPEDRARLRAAWDAAKATLRAARDHVEQTRGAA